MAILQSKQRSKHSILHPAQSGFRPQHTTQDVLGSMVDDWRKAHDKLVGAIMVDLSKAFDMENRSIRLRKMDSYGVRGKELRWFQDYLTAWEKTEGLCGRREVRMD